MSRKLLTKISVSGIYREASFKSETTTQSLIGEALDVLEEGVDWLRIRQHDGYEGWIPSGSICEKPDGWDDHTFFSPQAQVVWVHENPDPHSTTIRDMTTLSKLPAIGHEPGWVQLLLPDGQQGWVEDHPRFTPAKVDLEALTATAMQFKGIQYQWGGRSPKGFDCSGFVQSVYALNGKQLPRDAYMQAKLGELVDPDPKNWLPGDLIYFSERPGNITHVALSLGGSDFIHASGFVKINSLDPLSDLYIDKYHKIYTQTMRVS